MNYFEELNSVDCGSMIEKKNNLSYLSWSNAWKELKKRYPRSYYTIYQNDLEWNYFSDNKTCWVKTGVTVVTDDFEVEHIEFLPVMDYRNKSIPADMVTSFDVNKAIQRSLTKAVARHGLGLYVYAGEDLPDEADGSVEDRQKAATKSRDEVVDDIKEREIWRGKVLELANEKDIKASELSKDYKLGKNTTVERFNEVYADLKGEGNEAAK